MFRRLFYDLSTGNCIVSYSIDEKIFNVPTVDNDFNAYLDLSTRNKSSVGVIEFYNQEFEEDFISSNGVKVNLQTNELEFSYPTEGTQQPVYQKPLSEQVKELQQSVIELSMMLAAPQP